DHISDPEPEMDPFHKRAFLPVKELLLRTGTQISVGPGIRTLGKASSIYKDYIVRLRLFQTIPVDAVCVSVPSRLHHHILPADHQIHMELVCMPVVSAGMAAVDMMEMVFM